MRIRKQALGDRNIIGEKVEQQRKSMGMKQKDLLTQLQNGLEAEARSSKKKKPAQAAKSEDQKEMDEIFGDKKKW